MVRPKGKALKIAEKVVPGLKNKLKTHRTSHAMDLPKDDVELKIMNINETLRIQ